MTVLRSFLKEFRLKIEVNCPIFVYKNEDAVVLITSVLETLTMKIEGNQQPSPESNQGKGSETIPQGSTLCEFSHSGSASHPIHKIVKDEDIVHTQSNLGKNVSDWS